MVFVRSSVASRLVSVSALAAIIPSCLLYDRTLLDEAVGSDEVTSSGGAGATLGGAPGAGGVSTVDGDGGSESTPSGGSDSGGNGGGGSEGGSGGATLGGSGGTPAPGPCDAAFAEDNSILDDFEDGDEFLFERDGRTRASWSLQGPDPANGTVDPPALGFKAVEVDNGSSFAAWMKGEGFAPPDWAPRYSSKFSADRAEIWRAEKYDASAYRGIGFCARMEPAGVVELTIMNYIAETSPCPDGPMAPPCADVGHRILQPVTSSWRWYEIEWSQLGPGQVEPSSVHTIQFAATGADFEFFLDNPTLIAP